MRCSRPNFRSWIALTPRATGIFARVLALLGIVIGGLIFATLPTWAIPTRARDIIRGDGTVGPYSLSWRGITPDSELVQVDSTARWRALDYTVDPAAGTIRFATPLSPRSLALVGYDYDPATATPTGAPSAPFRVDVVRASGGSLSWLLQVQPAPRDSDGSGSVAMGVMGALYGARQSVASVTVMTSAPSSAPAGGDRLALQGRLAGDLGDRTHLALDYSRAGIGATGGASLGISAQPGAQSLGAKASVDVSRSVTAQAGYVRSEPLSGGSASTQADMTLTARASSAAQVQATVARSTDSGSTVGLEATTTGTGHIGMDTSFRQSNGQRLLALATTVTPTSAVQIQAAAQHRDDLTGAGSPADGDSVRLTLSPAQNVRLSGRYGDCLSPDGGGLSTTSLRGLGVDGDIGRLSVSSGIDWTVDPSAGDGQLFRLDLGWRLRGSSRLTGGYQQSRQQAEPFQTGNDIYTLGIHHDLGDRLTLGLDGTLTRSLATASDPSLTASAKLGLKF